MGNTMTWQVAAASEVGRHHRLLGKNRQDALCWSVNDAVVIAVTDGCGSALHSEVGAYLGVHAAVRAMAQLSPAAPDFCQRVAEAVLAVVDPALRDDAFLFTLCGACITNEGAIAFVFGDGSVCIDGQVHRFSADAPDYLAYHSAPKPVFARFVPNCTEVIVATDGCDGLDLPALSVDRHFTHPDALRRTLAKANCDDDATLIIARSHA